MSTYSLSPLQAKPLVIGCCGRFHYANYIKYLADSGWLEQFIFSHRISAFRGERWASNIFEKEYGVRILLRLISDKYHHRLFPVLHRWWDIRAAKVYRPAKILHVMLHGTSRQLIREAKRSGSVVVGELVNSHPVNYYNIESRAARECGVSYPSQMPTQLTEIMKELVLCDALLSPSKFVTDSLIQRGTDPSIITTIPFGANVTDFNPRRDQLATPVAAPVRVVCVAQVAPRKGIHDLIRAWQEMKLPAGLAELRLIGRVHKEMKWLTERAIPSITFLGAKSKASVISELQQAEIFVLPTLEEGFAVSILEAMSTGLPVITTTSSGAESIISNGTNGIIVPPSAPKILADSMRSLIYDPLRRRLIGNAALDTVRCGHTWADYVEALEAFYRGLNGIQLLD